MADEPSTSSRRDGRTGAPTGRLPRTVAVLYAGVAGGWILLSDLLVAGFDLDGETRVDIAKGLVFVAVTTLLLWTALRRLLQAHDRRLLANSSGERDFYRTILETTTESVAIFTRDGRVQWANQATTDSLGWTTEELTGALGREYIADEDRAAVIGYTENVMATQSPAPTSRIFRLRHRDGSLRTMEVRAAPLFRDEQIHGVVFVGRDVTDRTRRDDRIHALTTGDVTGLPPLVSFTTEMEWLERSLVAANVLIVMADIERFATVNELHGRATGDLVLREVAERFRSVLTEAVGCWRHGGDAFVAVVIERDDERPIDRREIVDRLRREIGAPIAIDDERRIEIDVAIGVAEARPGPGDPGLASTLLRAGEESLRVARTHPDRFVVDLPRDETGAVEDRAHVVAGLYDALREGQLVVHYQPIVDLDGCRVVGAEALVRWQHPTRGLLAPGAFFWAVQFANLTGEVTRTVLRQALEQLRAWRAAPGGGDLTVSVNITLNELRREGFVDEVIELLETTATEPESLCLELTEQALVADVAMTAEAVGLLRAAGVRIAIDDFGTGYSSLEHLRHLEVDELKIDRSFVSGLRPRSSDDVIVSSVIGLAHGLGVAVVAEGIDDAAGLAHLRDLGCQRGQGYLFSRPVPADEFPTSLRDPSRE